MWTTTDTRLKKPCTGPAYAIFEKNAARCGKLKIN